ncbi:MAG: hypothetical protein M1829_006207 [Trizodia sp. TS-e1964]|nr:MAG: hypothetical protein M1829_006207 [Trizodia sp. TS-e1964]
MCGLESLPLELLERVFLESHNCKLPLTSKNLLNALSGPRLPCRMIRTILHSKDASSQSDLIRHRLFDLEALLIAESGEISQPNPAGPRHFYCYDPEDGVWLPERLLCKFEAEPVQDNEREEIPGTSNHNIWKIDLLSCIFGYKRRSLSYDAALLAAASRGLHELVAANNLEAARCFLKILNATCRGHAFEPRNETIKLLLITRDPRPTPLLSRLLALWRPRWDELDAELKEELIKRVKVEKQSPRWEPSGPRRERVQGWTDYSILKSLYALIP